jgi:hypothetical protein
MRQAAWSARPPAWPTEMSTRRSCDSRPGIVYRAVTGVSGSEVPIAWTPIADKDPVVQDFIHRCLAAFGK